MTYNQKVIKAIDFLLKDLDKNAISKEHRKADIEIGCPECEFRLLEAYLKYYKDIISFKDKFAIWATEKKSVKVSKSKRIKTVKIKPVKK